MPGISNEPEFPDGGRNWPRDPTQYRLFDEDDASFAEVMQRFARDPRILKSNISELCNTQGGLASRITELSAQVGRLTAQLSYVQEFDPDQQNNPHLLLVGRSPEAHHVDLEVLSRGEVVELLALVATKELDPNLRLHGYSHLQDAAREFAIAPSVVKPRRRSTWESIRDRWRKGPPSIDPQHHFESKLSDDLLTIRKGEKTENYWKVPLRELLIDLQAFPLSKPDTVRLMHGYAGIGVWDHPHIRIESDTILEQRRKLEEELQALTEFFELIEPLLRSS